MLVYSLITLSVASVAAFISLHTQEDVFKAVMGFTAAISLFFTLVFAPWVLKAILIGVPLGLDKLNNLSGEKLI